MEMSITSETISQQTTCVDNEGLNANVESNNELTELEKMQNDLSKAREIYFKYLSSQKMVRTKATMRKQAMMGLPWWHLWGENLKKGEYPQKVEKAKLPELVSNEYIR